MIGMILVTHGRLADELIAALEHVVARRTTLPRFASALMTIWNSAAARS